MNAHREEGRQTRYVNQELGCRTFQCALTPGEENFDGPCTYLRSFSEPGFSDEATTELRDMTGTNGKFWLASIQSQRRHAGIRPRFGSERRLSDSRKPHDVQNPATCERPLAKTWEQMVPSPSDSDGLRSTLTKNRAATQRSCSRCGFRLTGPGRSVFSPFGQARSGNHVDSSRTVCWS
jgi:hypothetical protein